MLRERTQLEIASGVVWSSSRIKTPPSILYKTGSKRANHEVDQILNQIDCPKEGKYKVQLSIPGRDKEFLLEAILEIDPSDEVGEGLISIPIYSSNGIHADMIKRNRDVWSELTALVPQDGSKIPYKVEIMEALLLNGDLSKKPNYSCESSAFSSIKYTASFICIRVKNSGFDRSTNSLSVDTKAEVLSKRFEEETGINLCPFVELKSCLN